MALTPEEQEQRALYAAILEYEQDHVSHRVGCGPQACMEVSLPPQGHGR